ncbi:hypothetical protein PIB30_072864 [Stylosanthes scabra]|uniref:Uncharacterized protein n=1 Tax=Stylosanthes scabra TaxID=79078 RepID=A0ABU6QQC9_9FABA|nr:hypothetical protein [Stylosanthes scabra]
MAEEELIERLKKSDSSMVQVNVAQTATTNQKNQNSESKSKEMTPNMEELAEEAVEEEGVVETHGMPITIDHNAKSVES